MSGKKFLLYLVLSIMAVLYLLPLWATITTSLKNPAELASTSPIMFPSDPTLQPYVEAFDSLRIPYMHSILITLGGVFGSVVLGSVCGYVFSKIRFKHSDIIFILLAIGAFIPYQSVLVPLYITITKIGGFGEIWGLILTHTAYGIPMCAILFRSFYTAVPNEIMEQAKIDGAGMWRIYWHILLPVTALSMVIVVVFQFTSIWNEFLFGLVLGGGETQAMPVTVALNNLKGSFAAQWNVQMAGAMLVSIPVLIIYIAMGKYLIKGYMSGSIK